MIAKVSHADEPVVLHEQLATTFTGVLHPLSTPDALVHQFRGIKYATIPARFRQSKLCTSYPPQTDAARFGPICPQPRQQGFEADLFGVSEDVIPHQNLKQNEFDCLNLNITCPGNVTPESKLPVMLWIHGGGNRGSGSSWVYDGGALVQKSMLSGRPVIMVSINYRFGLLGFAASPALRDDNKAAGDEGVGNYGLRDQQRALEWVHRYITSFGGDPSNITLFGESTGAADIICHLHSAANDKTPLFQRCIVQSAIIDLEVPTVFSVGSQLSRIMGTLRVHTIDELRALEVDKLVILGQNLRATNDGVFFRKYFTGTIVDGDSPEPHHSHHAHHEHLEASHGVDPLRHSRWLQSHNHLRASSRSPSRSRAHHGHTSHQPIMIGDCSDESLLWSLPASLWSATAVERRIRAICQSLMKANMLLRAYDIHSHIPGDELHARLLELINDTRVAWPTESIANSARRERGGKGVYRYVFDQEGPARSVPHHGVDLIFLFDNVPFPIPSSPCSSKQALSSMDMMPDHFDVDDDDSDSGVSDVSTDSGFVEDWGVPVVDEYTYARVRDAVQERWLAFAHGEAPWHDDKVFVFGPEGEVGERSLIIFQGRRRTHVWKEALEPLGVSIVHKLGTELSNGPPLPPARARFVSS